MSATPRPAARRPTVACAVPSRDSLGESVLWCPRTRKVWWLDIQKPALQSFDPATRAHRVHPLPGRNCGNLALRRRGGFVLALDRGLHGFDPDASEANTGALEFLLHVEGEPPENRYNDGRVDRAGRLWIGTMDAAIRLASGAFYRIGADRSVTKLFGDISVPNSTAFSPDGRTLYFADTPRHAIWAFDFDPARGEIANRRTFVDLAHRKGLPDGSCVDAQGHLWNAEYGGARVVRYAPDGRAVLTIDLPVTNATCCCFGGDDLGTLYVTSAAQRLPAERLAAEPAEGGLLEIDVGASLGVRGLPEAMYGG
jgi:sugar lactone lactonase YvrE